MDVSSRRSASGDVVGVGEDAGTATVAIHIHPRFEGVLLDQADVPFIQQGVFHLQSNQKENQ